MMKENFLSTRETKALNSLELYQINTPIELKNEYPTLTNVDRELYRVYFDSFAALFESQKKIFKHDENFEPITSSLYSHFGAIRYFKSLDASSNEQSTKESQLKIMLIDRQECVNSGAYFEAKKYEYTQGIKNRMKNELKEYLNHHQEMNKESLNKLYLCWSSNLDETIGKALGNALLRCYIEEKFGALNERVEGMKNILESTRYNITTPARV